MRSFLKSEHYNRLFYDIFIWHIVIKNKVVIHAENKKQMETSVGNNT